MPSSCDEDRLRVRRRAAVSAFYLRPDADERALIEAAAGGPCRMAGVDLRWGDALPEDLDEVNVLIAAYPEAKELDALSPALSAVLVPYAGPTERIKALLRERPALSLHNCHFNAAVTAELAVAMVFALAKRVIELDAHMRREVRDGAVWTAGWQSTELSSRKLSGRTALVLGYGAIGRRCAAVLGAVGMEVHAVRRSASGAAASDGVAMVHGPASLRALLPRADVVVVCLPGTAETAAMLGRDEIRSLPQGALVVNVGRGNIVDECALYEALADGHLGGAGLDVWFNYPMLPGQGMSKKGLESNWPSSRPFHELPNVVMSQHRGQSSDTKAEDRVRDVTAMLVALAQEGELPNRMDLEAGY